ncbi:hypothetical protein ABT063_02640 [Streptomyces sp. NPDC002838]|uniref:hypothetical protein n=1 Tax=Streptomyces sp. NPDC002838 TaxID=3154436 RepID=UPI0033244C82
MTSIRSSIRSRITCLPGRRGSPTTSAVPATPASPAIEGALELVAVVSDAQRRNWREARRCLEQLALPLARNAGEGNVQWTVFGPTNVALHAMSIEMLAGEATEGLRVADQVDALAERLQLADGPLRAVGPYAVDVRQG